MDSSLLEALLKRAESLLARLEAVLPHALQAPDWAAATAFRYRKRGGSGSIEPVRHAAPIRLHELVEVEPQKRSRDGADRCAGRGAAGRRLVRRCSFPDATMDAERVRRRAGHR
jgi:hypothetical protein